MDSTRRRVNKPVLTAPPRDADVPLSQTLISNQTILLTWRVHLLRGQVKRLPLLGGVGLAVLGMGVLLFHTLLLAALPLLALIMSLSEFLFPCRYTLTVQGARARLGLMTLEIAWADVRHVYVGADGIKLSPLARTGSRMEPLRGVFLRFADNELAVTDMVRRLRQEAAGG